jgi:hypothetical protein
MVHFLKMQGDFGYGGGLELLPTRQRAKDLVDVSKETIFVGLSAGKPVLPGHQGRAVNGQTDTRQVQLA